MSRRRSFTTLRNNRIARNAGHDIIDRDRDQAAKLGKLLEGRRSFELQSVIDRLDRADADDALRAAERLAAYRPMDLGDGP